MATSIVRKNNSRNQQPTPNNNNQPLLLSPPKKSVSFDNNSNKNNNQQDVAVEIQEIERLDDQSLWYTNKDFKKFKRRDRKMCKLLFGEKMDPNTLEFMTGGNETPRGLENMSPFKKQLYASRKKACAEAIAMKQPQLFHLPSNESSEQIAKIHQDFSAKAKADAIKLASRDAQFVNDHILLSSTRRRVSCFSSLSPELLQFGSSSSDDDTTDDDDDDSTTETETETTEEKSKSKSKKASSTRKSKSRKKSSRPAMLERSPAMLDLVRHTTI